MPYQRIKCPRGHSFSTHIYSKHQRVDCPDCKRAAASSSSSHSPDYSAPSPSFDFTPSADTSSSSSSSDNFSSGGGGDFSGGGSSGDW